MRENICISEEKADSDRSLKPEPILYGLKYKAILYGLKYKASVRLHTTLLPVRVFIQTNL